LCPDSAGGVLVSWFQGFDAAEADLFVQRFTGDGSVAMGWPPSGVFTRRASASADYPLYPANQHAIAEDGIGGAFVLWKDRAEDPAGDYRIQHIVGTGQIDPRWPAMGRRMVLVPTYEVGATMIADGVGGVFVAWTDLQDSIDMHVHVQHLNAEGTAFPGWPESGMRPKGGYYSHRDPKLALDGAGGVWVGWGDMGYPQSAGLSTLDYTRVIHHVTAGGTVDPALPPAGIGVDQPTPYPDLGLVSDDAGGTYCLWKGYQPSLSNYGNLAQRFTTAGAPAAGWPALGFLFAPSANGFEARAPISDGRGGVFVVWSGYEPAIGNVVVRVQRIRSDGTIASGWDPAGGFLGFAAYAGSPRCVADALGGAIVVWGDSAAGGGLPDLFARHVSSDGVISSGPLTICTASGTQGAHQVAPDGKNGVYVLWVDQRADEGDVYLTRLESRDISTAALASFLDAEFEDRGVVLRWFSSDAHGMTFMIYRRTEGTGWAALSAVSPDAAGLMTYRDLTVELGMRYGYRLGIQDGDGERFLGETWITVPRAELSLQVHPNPANRNLLVSFSLPEARPATVELIDITGRVLAVRRADARAGRHVHDFEIGRAFAPGLYLVRLRQGGRSITLRACIVD
jgi:hypothetical protein